MTRGCRRAAVGIALAWLSLPRVLFAQPPTPELTRPVNDFANIIDAQTEAEIERRILALKQASGDVVVVATVPNVKGYLDINEYAVKMFENHGRGIGQKGKDNRLLIVVAVQERAVRIEPRYDLEELITAGHACEVISPVIVPMRLWPRSSR